MNDQLDNYRWLSSPEGDIVICSAKEWLQHQQIVAVTTGLRKKLSPTRTHLVIQQAQLRARAKEKFAAAERMFFTEIGLQQATGETIAQYKTKRFPADAHVIDMCCGIGGDLFSLARRGPATGIDCDEVSALLAEANCRALGLSDVKLRCEDVTTFDLPTSSLVHIDPDRRPQGRRTTKVMLHQPSETFLSQLITHGAGGAMKLAPAAEVPARWREDCELEWISHRGECKQLVVWFGSLAKDCRRCAATMLAENGDAHTIAANRQESELAPPLAEAIGRYLYEPDSAVIAARLVGALANRYGLAATASGIAYLTGDSQVNEPALACFEVAEVLPLDVKKLKAALRQRRIGRLEIKKRGVDLDPAELLRKMKCAGDEEATLIITPHAGGVIAILARRMNRGERAG